VVDRSAHYPEALLRAALVAAGIAAVVLFRLPDLGGPRVLLAQGAAVLSAVGLALVFPGLRRLLIGAGALDSAVRQRAVRAFLEHGVHRTQGETGVLVFASLFERRVVILGDRAIHEKMGDEGWRQAVSALVSGLRRGDPADGFVSAIAQVGARLGDVFPRAGAPTRNELPDALQVDR
jgi:putative membrane protein